MRRLTGRRCRRRRARRAARLTLSANAGAPVPVAVFVTDPALTGRERAARPRLATNAMTAIFDGPAGVVTLPRTTVPTWRRATFTDGGASSPPGGGLAGEVVSV